MKNLWWINVLIGLWLLVAPFVLSGPSSFMIVEAVSDILSGLFLIAAALYAFAATPPSAGAPWFQVLCGAWLIAAPYLLGYAGNRILLGSDVVAGGVAILVSLVASRAFTGRRAAA